MGENYKDELSDRLTAIQETIDGLPSQAFVDGAPRLPFHVADVQAYDAFSATCEAAKERAPYQGTNPTTDEVIASSLRYAGLTNAAIAEVLGPRED